MTRDHFRIAFIRTMHYSETGQIELARQWLGTAKRLAEGDQYRSDPQKRQYYLVSCALAEAGILLRTGSADSLKLLVSAADKNRGHAVMRSYFDLNTADIYLSRSSFGGAVAMVGANPDRYAEAAQRYRELISANPGYFPLMIGEYLYEADRRDEALPYLLSAMEEAQAAGCAGALVPAMVHLARIRRAKSDMPGAFEVLNECERKLKDIGKPHWNYLIEAFKCRLYIDAGAAEEIDAFFSARPIGIYGEISRIREYELIVLARALVEKGRADDAGILLQRLLAFAEKAGRPHSQTEVLNLLSMLACRTGHMKSAMGYLRRSMDIGVRQGYIRSYIDELSPMADLLARYVARRKKPGSAEETQIRAYAKQLLRHMQGGSVPAISADKTALAGGKKLLTAQEQRVLELLAGAYTNAEISAALGIQVRTVKAHAANIYSKLGVSNRVQCMNLIRESHLI